MSEQYIYGTQTAYIDNRIHDGEYMVKVYVDGIRYPGADYYTDDHEDAKGTARMLNNIRVRYRLEDDMVVNLETVPDDESRSLDDDGTKCPSCGGNTDPYTIIGDHMFRVTGKRIPRHELKSLLFRKMYQGGVGAGRHIPGDGPYEDVESLVTGTALTNKMMAMKPPKQNEDTIRSMEGGPIIFDEDLVARDVSKLETRVAVMKARKEGEFSKEFVDILKAMNRSLSWLSSYPGGGAENVYDDVRKAMELCSVMALKEAAHNSLIKKAHSLNCEDPMDVLNYYGQVIKMAKATEELGYRGFWEMIDDARSMREHLKEYENLASNAGYENISDALDNVEYK